MKSRFYLLVLILFSNMIVMSQSLTQYGWEWLNPKPTHTSLLDIKFTDINTGYAIGKNGTILKTTNRGINWYFLQTWVQPGFYDYQALYVFNKDTLIVSGSTPNFYKSTNGGSSWTMINTGSSQVINNIYFQNSLTGYAVGLSGTVLKTVNNGNSWQQIPTNLQVSMTAVSFPDINTGYIAGEKIVKTTNGGITWDTSSAVTGAYCINFLNNLTGFVGAYGLFMTTNGGTNWNNVSGSGYNFTSINFVNSQTGWASANNAIMKTTNGGFNWVNISTGQGKGISFVDSLNGYVCSADGYGSIVSATTNGGVNWSALSSRYETGDIYSIDFLNDNTGYYGGTSRNLCKTTDGGHNWTTIYNNSNFVESIYFFNENTGFIGETNGAQYGQIQKTTNGGLNWTSNFTLLPVNALSFADINTGYALASRNAIYKTTNSGLNWFFNDAGTDWINGIYVINSNRVMAVGEGFNFNIVKTTNGGQNWIYQHDLYSAGNAVWFTDINTGFVACGSSGYGGRIFKTTDFGETWTYQNLGNEYSLNAIQFFDANTGIVSGNNGTAFKTTNAGVNWTPYYRITDYHIFAMHCPNQNTCYFGGWYDIMLKMNNGGILVNTQIQTNTIPKFFSLYQNYPNPFNPNTKIKYSIPGNSSAKVLLSVYNILGQQVETLIDQQLQPGTYEAEFNGTNLPSGVYFYQLTVNSEQLTNYTETKKMVLIK